MVSDIKKWKRVLLPSIETSMDTYYCYSMFIFSELNAISKLETKTTMMEAEIKLIKAKCLSEDEIIDLIKSNIGLDKFINCPVGKHEGQKEFRIVDGTCFR